ncbi:MAG: outer membrane protein transport protein [Myxococcales bacterium]|nr:outer membrane protein transport protein [Myxococcales bacterium]MCB9644180.1 outer membrane protein transport protein [Myxococcales bacterium]
MQGEQKDKRDQRLPHGRIKRWLVMCCLWLGVCGFASSSLAAGFLVPSIGSRASGMGGAFIAGADDVTAIWHNPANLARLGGLRILADGAFVWVPFSFTRTTLDGQKPFPTTHNVGDVQPVPFFGISYDFAALKLPKMHKLAFAVAAWAPYNGNYYWDKDGAGNIAQPDCAGDKKADFLCQTNGPQRYSLHRYDPLQVYIGMALSYGLELPFMSIYVGGGFQLVKTDIYQSLTVKLVSANTADTTDDTPIEVNAGSAFQPSGNVGLTIAFPFGLSVGGSFQFPLSVRMEGTLKADIPKDFQALATLKGDKVKVSLELPWMARAGIAYQPSGFSRLKVEVAFVYEAWSSLKDITLDPSEITIDSPIPTFAGPVPVVKIQRNWQDSWSVRAGAQFAIIPQHFFVRAGYFYESGAIPNANFNVSSVHGERHGLGIGLEGQMHFGQHHFRLSASFTHVLEREVLITNSQERVLNISQTEEDRAKNPPPVVGNGTYRAGAEVFLVALAYRWGGK